MRSKEVRLVSRPSGEPSLDQFRIETIDLPDLREGEVLVRNQFISVDPYMRGRMNEGPSYVPPFEVGRVMEGGAVGRVAQSRDSSVPEDSYVLSNFGWRQSFVAPAESVQVIDPQGMPVSAFLGTLGMTGLTAWAGLFKVAEIQDGETVFVSAGSGAVGSMVCQLAALHRCRVVASAGSPEKIAFLRDELKVDYAFDYHDGDPLQHLRAGAPDGIHVYFDNTGGPQLEAALSALRPYGCVALCGAIAGYNNPIPGPRNLFMAIGKRLRLEGFLVFDFASSLPDFHAEAIPAVRSGKLRHEETVIEGIEEAPATFLRLLQPGGTNRGKVVIRVG